MNRMAEVNPAPQEATGVNPWRNGNVFPEGNNPEATAVKPWSGVKEEMKEKRVRTKRGSVLVEAALIMPLILLFFLGIFEFGQILMTKQMITNAAREAARAAAIRLDDAGALSSARTVSEDYLTRCNVDLAKVTIDPAFSTVNGMDAVEVRIQYNYLSSLLHWVPGIPETIALQSRVVMRREA